MIRALRWFLVLLAIVLFVIPFCPTFTEETKPGYTTRRTTLGIPSSPLLEFVQLTPDLEWHRAEMLAGKPVNVQHRQTSHANFISWSMACILVAVFLLKLRGWLSPPQAITAESSPSDTPLSST
jgi:bacteriorhodopsin